jgi:hypothetical protein
VLYKLVHTFQEALAKKGVAVWAMAGTALGAMRGQGIIPHDNDADFIIFESDVNKAVDAFVPVHDTDFKREENVLYARSWWRGCENATGSYVLGRDDRRHSVIHYASPPCDKNKGHIGVSMYDKYQGKQVKAHIGIFIAEFLEVDEVGSSMGTTTLSQKAFIDHLKPIPFGCSTVRVPARDGDKDMSMVRTYLNRHYGKDWDKTVNCNGQLGGTSHLCKLTRDPQVLAWELNHRAEPCYSPGAD